MKKIYSIYNENFEITHCEFFEDGENPINSTDKLVTIEVIPMYDIDNDIIYDGASLEEIQEIKKQNEYQLYCKRQQDGVSAYLNISAEFRLAKLTGIMTEEAHSAIEEILTPVRNEIMFGQWKKGLSILESIGILQIGSELYDRLHLQISNYINENY